MPRNARSGLGLFLLSVSLAASAQLMAPAGEADLIARGLKPLDDDALRALMNQQTLYHTNTATGQTYPIYYREDGRRFVKVGASVRPSAWAIRNGMRCDESAAGGQTICFKIFDVGGVLHACAPATKACDWTFTAARGDDEGIGK